MENNEFDLEQLEKRELDLRILYMFYQNVRSLCIGISILFTFFIIGHNLIAHNNHRDFVVILNIITVIVALIVLFLIKYNKLPQKYSFHIVSFIILLVFINTIAYMNVTREPLWVINIILIILGCGIFMLSFRWLAFIITTIIVATIADLYLVGLTENLQALSILLFLAYYFSFVANYLRISSTKKFQGMYLESQRSQNQMKNLLEEFTQAKNFAETINQLVPSAIFTVDLNNRITSWNKRAEKITGYKISETLGKIPQHIFRTTLFNVDFSDLDSPRFEIESELYIKSGNLIKILYSIDLLQNEEFYGATVSFEDITSRKMAEEKLAKSEKQYRSLQSNIPIGIYRSTQDGHLLSVNPAMVKMFGYDSISELMKVDASKLYVNYLQRKEFLAELIEKGKIKRYEVEMARKDGSHFWIAINSTAVYQNNVLIYFDGVLEDITQRMQIEKNLEQRDKILQALSVSSNTFLTKKDWQESIKGILKKYAEVLNVDRIYLFENHEDNDGLMTMRYAHSWQTEEALKMSLDLDPEKLYCYEELGLKPWLKQLMEKELIYGNVQKLAPKIKFLRENHIGSIMIVPIFVTEIFWGFIAFDVINCERDWTQMEVETLTMVADSIGAAINRQSNEDNLNQMYNSLLKELDIASSVQQYLLPDWLTKQNEMVFTSTYKPSSLIGGDLFDIIPISPSKTVVYMGDISGHGVQAALMMTAVKSIINMIISSNDLAVSPSFILQRLNKILSAGLFHDNYLTIILCIIDKDKEEINYFNAGHPPLIQYDLQSKEVEIIDEGGSIPVGWSLDFDYEPEDEGTVKFSPDKAFMLYTDGIFECENKYGEQFGIEGFSKFIKEQSETINAISLPGRFMKLLEDENYDITTDDFTLLSFKKITYESSIKYKKIFTIQPQLENIESVGKECFQAINESFQNEELANKVELLINEYLSNIIRHGISKDKAEVIGMEMVLSDDVSLVFWDKGIAWELPARNEEVICADKDRIGGFGMQIIYMIVEDISLQRYGDVNETVMKINSESKMKNREQDEE